MRASLHTLGCRLNQSETATLADRLRRDGYQLVPFGQPTDLLVLNTCSVTEHAESDCRYAIRHTLRHSPNAFVAVTGCYAQTGVEELRSLDGLDLIVGTQHKMQLPDLLPRPLRKRPAADVLHTRTIDRETFTVPGAGEYDTTRASLKVQDGCDFMCAFCLIPFARGHERSRDVDDILREARALAARGHRELVLTGVNIGRYREGGRTLLDVIDRLETIAGLDRIRVSSIEPTTIPDALLDRMVGSSKLCRHLHVPLQSGDDGILSSMKRRYTVAEYAAFVERAAARVPDIAIGTDVMVGFPGETEAAFERTVRLANDLPFSYLHVFSYSERPGTAANRLPDTVPSSIIAARSRTVSDISRAKRLAFYRRFEGREVDVLFETSRERGWQTGLTDNFIRARIRTDNTLTGERHAVRVTGVMDGIAVGTLRNA